MKKAEAARRVFDEYGLKLSNQEVVDKAKEKYDLVIKTSDVFQVRLKLERAKPILNLEILKKIRKFADEIGGVNLLQEGIELLKSFQRQENNY